ncbi:MAG: LuxR C-terminal-related transcriptional regulator [Microbacterium arborescens]
MGRGAVSSEWRETTPGMNRSVRAIVETMLRGRTVVATGPLGAGKSTLLNRVADHLRGAGHPHGMIRGVPILSAAPRGALETSSHPQILDPRSTSEQATSLAVVDDAQDLDATTIELLSRAVHSGQVAALICVTEPRLHADPSPAVRELSTLWLAGTADRLDLPPFLEDEGAQLIDAYASGFAFDSITRASLLWQADGSRRLLRALSETAVEAAIRGEDPLRAIDDVPAHSRLAFELVPHTQGIDDDALRALILLGRAPGLSFGDAARFIPSATLDELRSAGIVHDDRSILHRLTANRAIARAASRSWGRDRCEAIVSAVVDRMIADGGLWWNTALARVAAERWIRESDPASIAARVPRDLIGRVLGDAAREANDHGDASSAAAFATWSGEEALTPALSLEQRFARSVLGANESDGFVFDLMPAAGQRRTLAASVTLALEIDSSAETTQGPRPDSGEGSVGARLAAARRSLEVLSVHQACDLVEGLRRAPDLSASDQLDIDLVGALASAYLGREDDVRRQLRSAALLLRTGVRRGSTSERLEARCRDLAARTIAGIEDVDLAIDVSSEVEHAIHNGGSSMVLAGLTNVLALVRRGHVLEARVELMAALRRSPIIGGEAQGMITLEVALALALFGYAAESRELMALVDEPAAAGPVFRHTLALTRSALAVAEERWDEARMQAERAWKEVCDTDAAMLHIRSLHRLIVVGHHCAAEALDNLRTLRELVPSQTARVLVESAERASTAAADAPPTVASTLAHLCLELCPPGLLRRASVPQTSDPATAADARTALTPREREIAGLVNEGLTNRQIARTLFLSIRTVESHIYQARAKIGARNRTDLGALVASTSWESDEPHRAWG